MRKIEKTEKYNTLERCMRREIKSRSKELFNINNLDDKMKKIIKNLKMINWDNIEHFEMETIQKIPDSKITEIITKHYSRKGYTVKDQNQGIFIAEKEEDSLMINISNFGNSILASVAILSF